MAGSAWSLDLRPELVLLEGAPGAKVSFDLVVVNESTETVHVRMEEKEDWFGLSPRAFRLAAGAEKAVRLKGRVPKAMGEVAGEVRAVTVRAMSETRLVRRVLMRVAGTEHYEVGLSSPTFAEAEGKLVLGSVLENRGNVSVRPKVIFELEKSDGAMVTLSVDLTGRPVAPAASAPVEGRFDLAGSTWTGRGRVSAYFRDAAGKTHHVHELLGKK